jgi:hypothetical protein
MVTTVVKAVAAIVGGFALALSFRSPWSTVAGFLAVVLGVAVLMSEADVLPWRGRRRNRQARRHPKR